MNKNLALVLAIINIIMFGLYFIDTSRVQIYQWIITPMFAIFFTTEYLSKRKNK